MALGDNDIESLILKINQLTKQKLELSEYIQRKEEESIRIWQRDVLITIEIQDWLKCDKNSKPVDQFLKEISLKLIDDFKETKYSEEEVKALKATVEDLTAKLNVMTTNFNEVVAEKDSLKKNFEAQKAEFEKKKMELLYELKKTRQLEELEKWKLKKLLEKAPENNEVEELQIQLAKFEGMIKNCTKELKLMNEKVDFYKKML